MLVCIVCSTQIACEPTLSWSGLSTPSDSRDQGMDDVGLARCLRTADTLLSTSPSLAQHSEHNVSDLVESHRGCIRAIEQYAHDLAGPVATTAAAGAPLAHGQEDGSSCADVDPQEWQVPPHCVPIHANVTTYPWSRLYQHTQFDVIMMDPPWQLATSNPTRGVALGYSQLTDADIRALPIPQLQSNGLLFMWVINAKFRFTLELFEQWGYRLVDEIVWVKVTVNRRLAKSHGYYLQHAKEVCLVGQRGDLRPGWGSSVASDVILSERRGQSQKPEEIYELIEQLVPGGRYLEIFARKNNLRNFWVSVGNEVTGTGQPEDDKRAMQQTQVIPGAVYGRGAN